MIKLFKPFGFLLALSFSYAYLQAQEPGMDQKNNDESIIILKKDSSKEKVTVVIDGNNITVNGKPIEDFTSDDIDIIQQKNNLEPDLRLRSEMLPQFNTFRKDIFKKIQSNTAFLGVMTEKSEQGAKITDVTDGSAASKAGLKEDDIITKVDADKISGPDDLYKAVGKHKPEDKIEITYLRSGKQTTTNATLGKSEQVNVYSWNAPENFNYDFNGDLDGNNFHGFAYSMNPKPRLGISVQDTEDGNGVKVLDIDDDDSPAAKAGLKEGDLITQVNGNAIKSTDDLKSSMKDVKKGDTIKITYKRDNQTQTADIKFPKDLKTIDL